MSLHALHGIFWALSQLVTERVADDIAHEEDVRCGVDELILAGQIITSDIRERF